MSGGKGECYNLSSLVHFPFYANAKEGNKKYKGNTKSESISTIHALIMNVLHTWGNKSKAGVCG
jgi:hypothetical protein